MVGIKHVNMEEKIYEVLRKHKLPLKKREELMVDLCDLYNVSVSSLSFYDRLYLMMKQEYSELTKYEFDDLVKVLVYRHEKKKQAKKINSH